LGPKINTGEAPRCLPSACHWTNRQLSPARRSPHCRLLERVKPLSNNQPHFGTKNQPGLEIIFQIISHSPQAPLNRYANRVFTNAFRLGNRFLAHAENIMRVDPPALRFRQRIERPAQAASFEL